MSQQASSIKTQADVDSGMECDQLTFTYYCDQLGEMRRDLLCRHEGLQVRVISARIPGQIIYGIDVWIFGASPEGCARVNVSTAPSGEGRSLTGCRLFSELLQSRLRRPEVRSSQV